MSRDNIIPLPPKCSFTPQAEKRWAQIQKSMQKDILDNVWCGSCRGSSVMIMESGRMERGDLILRGKCKACGNEVCRVVEG